VRRRRKLGRWDRRAGLPSKVWAGLGNPLAAWLLHAAALWLWHLPWAYQAALEKEPIHLLEHGCFFATACLFWWPILGADSHRRLSGSIGVPYVFTMRVQSGVLGAMMPFSGRAWYAPYEATAPEWRLTALDDQQLAGLIMWVPAGALYTLVALGVLGAWLNGVEGGVNQPRASGW